MSREIQIAGVVAIAMLVLLVSSFVIVNSGHVGVVRRLGAVQMEHLPEGFHLKAPFLDSVEETDIRLRAAEKEASASSKDLQVVRTQVAVQYSMTGAVMPLTYQKIGTRRMVEGTLIDPAIQESVKAITAQYTAEELVTRRGRGQNQDSGRHRGVRQRDPGPEGRCRCREPGQRGDHGFRLLR